MVGVGSSLDFFIGICGNIRAPVVLAFFKGLCYNNHTPPFPFFFPFPSLKLIFLF